MHNGFTVRALTAGAVIAAMYTAVSLIFLPVSMGYGGVDLRIAEALTLLPVMFPEAVPALAVGCLLTNILGGGFLIDIVGGTLATLLAALCTRRLRDKPLWMAAMPPVVINALVIGAVLRVAVLPDTPLLACMASVGAGQLLACYALGVPLMLALRKLPGAPQRRGA